MDRQQRRIILAAVCALAAQTLCAQDAQPTASPTPKATPPKNAQATPPGSPPPIFDFERRVRNRPFAPQPPNQSFTSGGGNANGQGGQGGPNGQRPPPPFNNGGFENARRIFEGLAPEQQMKLKQNLQLWQNMPPEERKALRDNMDFRRARIMQEIDTAIKGSGLQLDEDKRQVYMLRYTQERRKIEEQLRKEMEAKRQPMLDAMVKKLNTEFTAPPPAASPAPSPK